MATCTDCGFVHDVVCQPGRCGFDLVASDHALRAENELQAGNEVVLLDYIRRLVETLELPVAMAETQLCKALRVRLLEDAHGVLSKARAALAPKGDG